MCSGAHLRSRWLEGKEQAGRSLLLGDTGKTTGSKGLREQKIHVEETPVLRVQRRTEEHPERSQPSSGGPLPCPGACGPSSCVSLYCPSVSQEWVPALCSIVLAPGSAVTGSVRTSAGGWRHPCGCHGSSEAVWGDGRFGLKRSVCSVQREQPELGNQSSGFWGRRCGFREWGGYK